MLPISYRYLSIYDLSYKRPIVTENSELLREISGHKPVRIFLPLTSSGERYRLNCILRSGDNSHFTLLFQRGTLPVAQIDTSIPVIINVDISGQSVSLEAKIIAIPDSQTMNMIPLKTINHEQMREYFRADCVVPLLLTSTVPKEFKAPEDDWKISGTSVDLSGSGLRASFGTAPPAKTQVRLELALPTIEPTIVKTLASPVRISQLTEKLWDAAYYFDDIAMEDQDAIIACCLVAQRRLLRLKVQVKGS